HASRSGRPPALRRAPRTRGGHFALPVRTRDAGGPLVGGGDDVLVDTGELLWLEDSPTVASTSAGSVNDSAPLPPWRRACAADRSDGAVEHEDLGSRVGLDVVGAHERHHRALGEALDGLDQARSHRLLKGPADLQDLSVLARL